MLQMMNSNISSLTSTDYFKNSFMMKVRLENICEVLSIDRNGSFIWPEAIGFPDIILHNIREMELSQMTNSTMRECLIAAGEAKAKLEEYNDEIWLQISGISRAPGT